MIPETSYARLSSLAAGLAFFALALAGCGKPAAAAQALRGSCDALASKSLCTEYYDFTPGYVRDLCGMDRRTYTRSTCPRKNVVGKCTLAGNTTYYYSTGGKPFTNASARKHCEIDAEALFEIIIIENQ